MAIEEYILGVDIGTGSTKSVAVNTKGEAYSVEQSYYKVTHPQKNFSEQDPNEIWQAFIESVRSHVEKLHQPPLAICLSSAMHSIIPVDANGNALSNMMTWADGRSADFASTIKTSPEAEEIYRTTGTPIHPMSPLCKIAWIKENDPQLFNKTYKFISIKEFIWYRLFNEFKADISIASATGLLNIITNTWYEKALQIAGITNEKLSTVVAPSYTATDLQPAAAQALQLNAKVPVIIGASDGCLANVGSFSTGKQTAALTIGTSGAVRITGNKPVYNYEAMSFNYKLDESTFISGGAVNNGGNTLQWYLRNFLNRQQLSNEDYVNFFNSIKDVRPASNGLLFLPYINGERAPYWDSKTCGVFFGIKEYHTANNFSKALIEGICYALNNVLHTVEDQNPITQINVSGGFVASEPWLQILADITGKRLCVINNEDASSIGAAYFAMMTLKLIDDYESLKPQTGLQYIEPNADNHKIYKPYFDIFRNLYGNLQNSMHQLHNLVN